jgi:RNA recognition motif-containing protein
MNKKQEELNRVFVGNVPFQCTSEEFQDCFKEVNGYVTAEPIKRYGSSDMSRGFGYVVFDTNERAEEFLNNSNEQEEFNLKDRVLRFDTYQSREDTPTRREPRLDSFNQRMSNYKIFIDNLAEDTTKDDLQDCFSEYSDIIACFVNISKPSNEGDKVKNTGVIIFSTQESCQQSIDNPPVLKSTNEQLFIKPYKQFNQKQVPDVSKIYNKGYESGRIVGFQEGFNKAQSQSNIVPASN